MTLFDVAIVGAGPAGLSAAVEARARGLSVLVLDENRAPGGRIWESVEARADETSRGVRPFTREDAAAAALVGRFRASGATIHFNASVWGLDPSGGVLWRQAGTLRRASAKRVVVATGAMERPLPLEGWTLPGVMSLGGAQILLKSSGLVPTSKTWIAGQGPLLLLYVVQVLRAGGRVAGVIDFSQTDWLRNAQFIPSALRSPSYVFKGLGWMREIRRAGVKWIKSRDVAALGEDKLEQIRFSRSGQVYVEEAEQLLLHDGVIPSTHLSRALGCEHVWDDDDHCWRPQKDEWGVSSIGHIVVAGDGGGIMGAQAAELSGRIAALGIAQALGRITVAERDRLAAPLRRTYARHASARPLLRAMFAPYGKPPGDATIVCRCEEVTAGSLREAVRLGCLGVNQLKAYTRCCMGPCQGRMCGPSVQTLIASERGVPCSEVEPLRVRFPIKPVTVGEIAAMDLSST